MLSKITIRVKKKKRLYVFLFENYLKTFNKREGLVFDFFVANFSMTGL